MKTRLFQLFLLSLFSISTSAQQVEFEGYLGNTLYLGDLAPLRSVLSYAESNVAWTLGLGVELSESFTVHGRFTLGKLEAYDANSPDRTKRLRNLSFQSPLTELSLITDYNLNKIFTGLNKSGLKVYVISGVAMFLFEPQALHDGKVVLLRTLGTEGQGLPGREKFYSNVQISIPFGAGVSFNLSSSLKMGLEAVPRLTFTDYLDDVSTIYVARQEFLEAGREQSANLSNRTGEYLGEAPINYPTGTPRGSSDSNDWYVFVGLKLAYLIGQNDEKPKKILDPLNSPAEIQKEE